MCCTAGWPAIRAQDDPSFPFSAETCLDLQTIRWFSSGAAKAAERVVACLGAWRRRACSCDLAGRPPQTTAAGLAHLLQHPGSPCCLPHTNPPPCSREEETNQTVIEGMGELHLEIIVDRLRREFKVECDVGAPQVRSRLPVL